MGICLHTMRHTATRKPRKRIIRWPGICADSRALGVNTRTLQRVLSGEWQSKTLSARYRQLKSEKLSERDLLLISDFNRRQAKKGAAPP
jgi:hypothetical protein